MKTEADKHNWTKQELEDYERASIRERDEIGRIALAEKRAEKKAAQKVKEEVARSARQMGLSLTDIIKLTGLTEDEIDDL